MKNILKILFVASIGSLMGCESYLEKDPIGLITPDQINTNPTVQSLTSSVNATYQLLSNTLNVIGEWDWTGGTVLRNDFVVYDIASGDMMKKWNPDGDQAWMDEVASFNFTSINGAFNGVWSYNYEGISRANLAIKSLEDGDLAGLNMTQEIQDRLLGEVYFLRAFYYFELANNFGDIPLLTKPLENFSEAYEVAIRVPKEEAMVLIKADLEKAVGLLPVRKYANDAEPWRVPIGAAKAMQAKIALYEQDWVAALGFINQLEAYGFYQLNPNYFDSFDVSKEFQEQEVILAYDHREALNPGRGNGLAALTGWGFIAPSDDFLQAFEPNDPRLAFTVEVEPRQVHKLLGSTDGAYRGNDDSPGNKIFIRYADVLLWKAEALIQTGDITGGLMLIDQIRERARTSPQIDGTTVPADALPAYSGNSLTKDQAIAALIHERRVELGFESHRFNDLKRWGIAKEVLTGLGKNFQDHHYLYPVPQGEIDRSGAQITQNPGY